MVLSLLTDTVFQRLSLLCPSMIIVTFTSAVLFALPSCFRYIILTVTGFVSLDVSWLSEWLACIT